MSIDVVIGANYGDEGKGLVTDYLTHRAQEQGKNVAVVRFNGGAQAGHTVELADGTRHVFSHIGAGALLGADTVLSAHFVLNPTIFYSEVVELGGKATGCGAVYAYAHSPITTPYEVVINRAMERIRGDTRHGSVGVGFGETIERDTSNVIFTPDNCSDGALDVVEKWFWARIKALGIKELTDAERSLVSGEGIDRYKDHLAFMMEYLHLYRSHSAILQQYDHLVFEGAQGLLLDMDYGTFPHVTRSNTGLRNVVDIVGRVPMDVYYVTRTYLTRHGAGPLPNEYHFTIAEDRTNVTNAWQHRLRFAPLDTHQLNDRCERDVREHNPTATAHYAITWNGEYHISDGDLSFPSIRFNGKTRETLVDYQMAIAV